MADLVLNLTANASNFAAGMKSAQKAANSLFLDTRTNLERFKSGLENIRELSRGGFIDLDTVDRARKKLTSDLDTTGIHSRGMAKEKAEAERLASNQQLSQKIIAADIAESQAIFSARHAADMALAAQQKKADADRLQSAQKVTQQVTNANNAAMPQGPLTAQQWTQQIIASERSAQQQKKAEADRIASARQLTQSIIASERSAAQVLLSVRAASNAALASRQVKDDAIRLQAAHQTAQQIAAAERSANIAIQVERVTAERKTRQIIASARASAYGAVISGRGGIGGNRAMIVQQLAFAAEDAATQFGTRGLAGAVMAAGNNLTFAASMMSPMIGVMSSVGLTAAMLAMTYFKVGNSAKKAAEETKTLKEETEKLGSIIKARREFMEAVRGGGSEQNRDRLKSLKGELSDEEKLLIVSAGKTSRARLEILQAESRARKKNEETNAVAFMAGPGAIVIPVKANENAIKQDQAVVAARKKYIEVLAEETRIKSRIGVINSRSEDIEKRLLELRKANRESLQTGIWQARQDEIKKAEESAKGIRMQNPAFRFNEELKELDKLKEAKVLSEAEYQAERMRMEKDAVEQIRSQQKQNSQMKLTSAVDIRSAEAGSVIANAFAKAMSPQSDDPKALLMQQLKALNLIADRQKEIAAINNKQLGQQMKTGGNVELQMVN